MTKTHQRKMVLAILVAASFVFFSASAEAKRSVAQKKQIAQKQFETAERLREALEGKPVKARSKRDFTRVTDAYRKVYYTAPTSSKADASVLAVAELLVKNGRAFQDEKSFRAAIAQYEFLRREYPGSKRRFEALFTEGEVYREDLGDAKQAKQIFEEFLKRYPRNELADQARGALNDMAVEAKGGKTALKRSAKKSEDRQGKKGPASSTSANEDDDSSTAVPSRAAALPVSSAQNVRHGKYPLVTNIRYWSTPDYTRVAIDLEEEVKYEAGRVPSPDRIFFDLHDTKLASELVGKTFEIGDGFLRKIRIAQFSTGLVRVVLEVDDVAEYSAFLLPNPYRLIVDVHGKQNKTLVAKNSPPPTLGNTSEASKPTTDSASASKAVKKSDDRNLPASTAGRRETQEGETSTGASGKVENEPPVVSPAKKPDTSPDATKELTENTPQTNKDVDRKEVKATSQPTSAPTFEKVAPIKDKKGKRGKKKKDKDEEVQPIRAAEPNADGDRSLIRALGLKIGKIVVDAGHGGHDTGTIGPHGLMEKDLVLDVALRLGKLLEQQLGAEVIYTRDDDTFVPLETRTAIANKHEADLFISVHANSSRDASARGVETYYLNFTSNADALEVAARENAVSQKSVYELQDLVKKIALKEKIEESREFAADVEKALSAGLGSKNSSMRDRGVKKAPFVVLIGANMPSILAEISFVSNPSDEKKLQTPEYRQRVAESLYKGVARYASGLSGVKVASKMGDAATP